MHGETIIDNWTTHYGKWLLQHWTSGGAFRVPLPTTPHPFNHTNSGTSIQQQTTASGVPHIIICDTTTGVPRLTVTTPTTTYPQTGTFGPICQNLQVTNITTTDTSSCSKNPPAPCLVVGRSRPMQQDQYNLLHSMYAHRDIDYLCSIFKLTKPTTKFFCVDCAVGKLTRQPVPLLPTTATKPGEVTHMDLSGKFDVPARGCQQAQYYIVCVDEFTKSNFLGLLAKKSDALRHFKAYVNRMKALNYPLGPGSRAVADNDKADFRSKHSWTTSRKLE